MKLSTLTLSTLLAVGSNAAFAETYTLLIYETPATLSQRDASDQADSYWSAYDGFAGAMAQAGVLRGGTAVSAAVPIKPASGSPAKASAVPQISGYFVIEVPGLAEARSWAGKVPSLVSAVEIFPHRANPHMSKP